MCRSEQSDEYTPTAVQKEAPSWSNQDKRTTFDSISPIIFLQWQMHRIFLHLKSLSIHTDYENWNIQTSKPPTSNRTLAALERRLKVDIEFYHYLQQRFYKQLEEVKGHYRGLKM